MLIELHIENILLIDQASIFFEKGFSVITGQTGAGKSILLDSLGIILGERAGNVILRDQNKHGIIVATFETEYQPLKNILFENGYFYNSNDNTIIIKKIITKNGSKIFINDIPSTVQFINSIASFLVEIYSQFEQTELFSVKKHLEILDRFGALDDDILAVKNAFCKMKEIEEKFIKTKNDIDGQKANLEYLQSFIDDMSALNLLPNEYDELMTKKHSMTDAEKVSTYISNAEEILQNSNFGSIINKVQNVLSKAEQQVCQDVENNKTTDNTDNSLSSNINNINELLDKLYNDYSLAVEAITDISTNNHFDEYLLNEVEGRIAAIKEIARKYQTTPQQLQEQFEMAKNKVAKINLSDSILSQLKSQLEEQQQQYNSLAKDLSNKRKTVAKKLENIILEKLKRLKMDKVQFYTNFEDGICSEYGVDKVVFFASMNPGMTPLPIHKIASGGELSRFMLAFKSALCEVQNTATVIFDEIDTGVSGSVAYAIGKELAKLGILTQTICITHNSQTTACAKHHYLVVKEQNLEQSKTVIKKLSYQERITAIAEMISCDNITEESIQTAKKILEENHNN